VRGPLTLVARLLAAVPVMVAVVQVGAVAIRLPILSAVTIGVPVLSLVVTLVAILILVVVSVSVLILVVVSVLSLVLTLMAIPILVVVVVLVAVVVVVLVTVVVVVGIPALALTAVRPVTASPSLATIAVRSPAVHGRAVPVSSPGTVKGVPTSEIAPPVHAVPVHAVPASPARAEPSSPHGGSHPRRTKAHGQNEYTDKKFLRFQLHFPPPLLHRYWGISWQVTFNRAGLAWPLRERGSKKVSLPIGVNLPSNIKCINGFFVATIVSVFI
jgi:hypothetical protein